MDPTVEKYIGSVKGLLKCLETAAESNNPEDWVDVGYCEVAVAVAQRALDEQKGYSSAA